MHQARKFKPQFTIFDGLHVCVLIKVYIIFIIYLITCASLLKTILCGYKEEKGRKLLEEDVSALKRRALKRDLEYLRQSSEPGREDRLR